MLMIYWKPLLFADSLITLDEKRIKLIKVIHFLKIKFLYSYIHTKQVPLCQLEFNHVVQGMHMFSKH